MMELTTLLYAAVLAISIFVIICIFRVFLGPTAADRTVGLDTINTLVVGGMIALGAAMTETLFIDIAIVYAILSFITTLFVAKYLEGGSSE
ncbi:MAG: cation:proton antiporter [Thermoplasmata archaeon]